MPAMTSKGYIARYIWGKNETSKQEINKELEISMPTVLQNVNALMREGILKEVGEYKSSGGRKAKAIAINEKKKYSTGIDITRNHVSFVMIDFSGKIVRNLLIRKPYASGTAYYEEVNELFKKFVSQSKVAHDRILGIGISLPGVLNCEHDTLIRSHALSEKNLNLGFVSKCFSYPVKFENDANSGLLSELQGDLQNGVYLSLSNTVGGAFCMDGQLYMGDNSRAGEVGHMIIRKDGAECYCGKKGCFDAYCAAHVLSKNTANDLKKFFVRLEENDVKMKKVWDEYLDYLAIEITNIRMSYDCDIILGGYVGAYIESYMPELIEKTRQYNNFDQQISYIKICKNKLEAAAVGAAMEFLKEYLLNL